MVISGTQILRLKRYPSRFFNTVVVRSPKEGSRIDASGGSSDVTKATASYIILWV